MLGFSTLRYWSHHAMDNMDTTSYKYVRVSKGIVPFGNFVPQHCTWWKDDDAIPFLSKTPFIQNVILVGNQRFILLCWFFSYIKILRILPQVCVFDVLRTPERTHQDSETSMVHVLDDKRSILSMALETLQNDVVAVLLFQRPALHPKLMMRIVRIELHENLRVCRFEWILHLSCSSHCSLLTTGILEVWNVHYPWTPEL